MSLLAPRFLLRAGSQETSFPGHRRGDAGQRARVEVHE